MLADLHMIVGPESRVSTGFFCITIRAPVSGSGALAAGERTGDQRVDDLLG